MRCYKCRNSKWIRVNKDYECKRMPKCLMEDVERREYFNSLNLQKAKKVRFKGEKRFWKIKACDEYFMICTWGKFYTICDLQECIRGADNHYGYYDYKDLSPEMLEIALAQFHLEDYTTIDKLDVSDKAKQAWKDYYYVEDNPQLTEQERNFINYKWEEVPNLEISYRNWVELDIEEVKYA